MAEQPSCGSWGNLAHWIMPGQPGLVDVVIVPSVTVLLSLIAGKIIHFLDLMVISSSLCICSLSIALSLFLHL